MMISRSAMWRAASAFFVAALVSAPAFAQGDPVAAEALFHAAHADMERGEVASACTKFRESQRLDPAVGTVLNIADCSEKLGLLAEAWQRYREAADKLAPDDERRPYALEKAEALEPRLPRLTIVGESLPDGAVVERDGVPIGAASMGVALPIDPGEHTVVVKASGRRDREYRVKLVEGERRVQRIEVGERLPPTSPTPVPAPAPVVPWPQSTVPTPPSVEDDDGEALRTAGWVVGGLGLGITLLGAVAGALTLGSETDILRECDTSTKLCESERGVDAAERGVITGPLTTVGLTVGGLGVAVGGILLGVGYSSESTTVSLNANGDGASASLRLSF